MIGTVSYPLRIKATLIVLCFTDVQEEYKSFQIILGWGGRVRILTIESDRMFTLSRWNALWR